MRIYFDVCCLSRACDDQSQERVRLESEAIRVILERVESGSLRWISSSTVEFELLLNPDEDKRQSAASFLVNAAESVPITDATESRALALEAAVGLDTYDALHLALAEDAGCDILFTVDDGFIRKARRLSPLSAVRVLNPLRWLSEFDDGGQTA